MGQSEGNIDPLQLTQREMPDPRTQQRQEHLFRQAEQYAGQSPFQQQYGYGSSMVPGLSGMSQTGQQYLTDRILGKGAYRVQNLGFQNYVRPDTALAGGYQYGQSGYQAGDEFEAGRRTSDRQQRYIDNPTSWFDERPDINEPDGWYNWTPTQQREWIANQGTPLGMSTAPGSTLPAAKMQTTGYAAVNQPGYSPATQQASTGGVGLGPQPGPVPGQPGYVRPGRERSDWSPWMGETYEEGAPSGMAGVNQPGYELNIWDTPDIPFGTQNLPTRTSGEDYLRRSGAPADHGLPGDLAGTTVRGLLTSDLSRPTAGVGIGEIEDARTATRRMLMEGGAVGDPGYNQFLGADGWQGLGTAAGTGAFLPAHTDAEGNTYAAGWHGLGKAGTGTAPTAAQTGIESLSPWQQVSYDPETGERIVEDGTYAPEYDAVSAGDVTGAATDPRYTDPTIDPLYKGWSDKDKGLTEADKVTDILGRTDPTTGKPITGKQFREGWGITDPTIGTAVWNPDDAPWKGLETVAQTGEADWLDVSKVKDPTLTDAERIEATEVGEADTAGFAVTPAAVAGLDTISAPTDVTIDPLYKDWSEAERGTAETSAITDATRLGTGGQDAFTGATFLGGDLGAYMDVGGVDAQIAAAQLDFQRAQNEEQARRAQSLAWGTRGDIPRAEQETAMLARIAEIRRKGYSDAADRMEADLQRQQAAGMQAQQLGTQGALQAQQLEAQRVGDRAARAQQAALAQQQLGAQAGMQTQQLKQQGGIRGAELGMQAGLQAQQLEAQRLEANAARVQQAALAGQELAGRYGLQTQQLGQQAAMRNAEMDMQAALANQQAALQTGTQSQQLEAQRQIEQARLKLAGQQQTQQLGVQTGLAAQSLEAQRAEAQAARAQQAALAQYQGGLEGAMQTQRLGVGADQRQAELDMQAALANQQAALQTGSQAAQLEAGRRAQQAQLDLQRLQQTQQLGADAAAQQTQNEFARRQALATMGQDAATQQTQNEFARRQALAEMGLRAQGMGMDDQARFREQQMALAQQLGRQGLDEQAATFAAAQQLAQMGGTQEQRQQMQAAADYEQWLRSQEGFADEAAFLQAMQPQAGMAQYQRKPSTWGQIAGGLLAAGGTAAQAFGSDARIKDNIEYVGMENGFKTYEFNYLGRDNRYRGVIAQEVIAERPDAVEMQDGFYRVNYDAIGVQFEAV